MKKLPFETGEPNFIYCSLSLLNWRDRHTRGGTFFCANFYSSEDDDFCFLSFFHHHGVVCILGYMCL